MYMVYIELCSSIVFDEEKIKNRKEEVDQERKEAKKRHEEKQAFEAQFITEEVEPKVMWKGPKRLFTVFGFEMVIKDGFETKEAAEKALSNGSLSEEIAAVKSAYIDRASRNGG